MTQKSHSDSREQVNMLLALSSGKREIESKFTGQCAQCYKRFAKGARGAPTQVSEMKKTENICPTNVHNRITHNNQKVETTQMSK